MSTRGNTENKYTLMCESTLTTGSINKMRLAQQNSVTSLKEECQRQMLAAAHTLALDSKNLLDAVDQARVRADRAGPRPEDSG